MKTQWILVADSASARIFEPENQGTHLKLVQELQHPQSRDQGQKDGKGSENHGGRDEASVNFARELGTLLTLAHSQNHFADLVIVADPRFLGMLRPELSSAVEGSVSRSIGKHAVQMGLPELIDLVAKKD